MTHSAPVADSDRLPWLEPYRESPARGGRLPRRGYARPIAWGAALGLAIAAAAGGFWLGQREAAPEAGEARTAPRSGPSAIVELPEAVPAPAPLTVPARPPEAEPNVAPPAEPLPKAASTSVRSDRASYRRASYRKASKRRSRARKIRTAGVESSHLRAVRAAQGERIAPARRVQVHRWPKMPSPGPAGQVIQLGAFTTPTRANAAYRVRVARYPVLQRMPRVVVPIITQPDRRVLYVLRLGTTSRQHSHVVCNNLRRSGDHCLVIG